MTAVKKDTFKTYYHQLVLNIWRPQLEFEVGKATKRGFIAPQLSSPLTFKTSYLQQDKGRHTGQEAFSLQQEKGLSNNTQAYIPGPIYIGLHTTACIQRSTYRTRACLQQYKGLHTFRKGSNSPGSQHQHIISKTQARSSFLQIFQPYSQTIIQKLKSQRRNPFLLKFNAHYFHATKLNKNLCFRTLNSARFS